MKERKLRKKEEILKDLPVPAGKYDCYWLAMIEILIDIRDALCISEPEKQEKEDGGKRVFGGKLV